MRKKHILQQNQVLVDMDRLNQEKIKNLELSNKRLIAAEKIATEKLYHSHKMRIEEFNRNIPKPSQRQIKSMPELMAFMESSKSIYVKNWKRSTSTAFFMNWNIRTLKTYINRGYFFTSKPNESC